MLNDSDYLESVDITPYTSTLISQLITARPEKTAAFCKEYFDRLSSSQHVIGQSYATITQCRWNRRSFVKCCRESFENFDPDILATLVKSTVLVEPDTTNDPVIDESPFLDPSHSVVTDKPVNPAPLPKNDPLKIEADT